MAFNWVKFPWTNLHDLNLDWIIQTVKSLEKNLSDAVGQFTEIVNTAVGAEREERVAKDAEIQAEITTEVYPAISKSITDTITGSGDLTIDKTGDVNITGNNVRITSGSNTQMIGGAFISDGGQQLVMHNPDSNTSVTANYNSGVLTLTNNQEPAKGVAVYPINTPADGGGDNSDFAANVGYVKTAVEAVGGKLDTEISNRTSGDAALQSEIDRVKTLLNIESNERQANDTAIRQNTIFNITANISDDFTGGNITLDSTVISQLKAALSINRLVSLTLQNNTVASSLYETRYLLLDKYTSPPSANGEYAVNFYNVGKTLSATIDTATGALTYSEF